jgi:hypothetical protein
VLSTEGVDEEWTLRVQFGYPLLDVNLSWTANFQTCVYCTFAAA